MFISVKELLEYCEDCNRDPSKQLIKITSEHLVKDLEAYKAALAGQDKGYKASPKTKKIIRGRYV
jgi:hypothetical protein